MRPIPAPPARLDLAVVLHALADPVRLSLIAQLDGGEPRACGTLDVPVSKSTLTHHFKVLRESGIVETHREGARVLNSVRRTELDTEFPGLLDAVLNGHRTQEEREEENVPA